MRIWVVEYTFKNGGLSGVRGDMTRATAFYTQAEAEAEAKQATGLHGHNTEYRAVAYVPEESK